MAQENMMPRFQSLQTFIRLWLPKVALLIFGIALWHRGGIDQTAYNLLLFAWLIDGGPAKLWLLRKEPFIVGIFGLVIVFALGLLWSDGGNAKAVLARYSILLVFIPYWLLLNRERLAWAVGGLAAGFASMLIPAAYASLVGVSGIPGWERSYISASIVLGSAALLAFYFALRTEGVRYRLALFPLGLFLLFLQAQQNARGAILSTLIVLILVAIVWNLRRKLRLAGLVGAILLIGGASIFLGDTMQERINAAAQNLQVAKEGDFKTSLGYRLAVWDIGWHSIQESPWLGQGTGMAIPYINQTSQTYKPEQYAGLATWLHTGTYHFHNDLIEIGVHTGLLGIGAFMLFLAGWFETLRRRGLWKEAVVMISFFVLLGMTDVLFVYRWMIYFFLALTAIALFVHSKEETARA